MPRRSNVEIGDEWENYVRNFFRQLGFENVDGGHGFQPGGRGDIDLVAGINNVLFIGECKTRQKIGERTDLISEARKFASKAKRALTEFGKSSFRAGVYSKYSYPIIFMAIKDIVVNEETRNSIIRELTGVGKAFLFDEKLFNYYIGISEQLQPKIAQWHLLGDIGANLMPYDVRLRINTIKTEIKGFRLYSFVTTPQRLLPYIRVVRREVSSIYDSKYYQRIIDGSRCDEIKEYLDNTGGDLFQQGQIIPGSVILALDPRIPNSELTFTPIRNDEDYGELSLPKRYGSLMIVDGQHRLYSFSRRLEDIREDDKILITLLVGMSLEQQRKIFVDINNEQKSVDFSYILDIDGDAIPNTEDGIISNGIKKLDKIYKLDDKENIFFNQIKIPSHGIRNRKFSMKALYQAIKRSGLIKKETVHSFQTANNPFYDSDYNALTEKLSKGLAKYFILIKTILGDEIQDSRAGTNLNKMLDGRGKDGIVDIFINLYERIISIKNKSGRPNVPTEFDLRKYLNPIADFFKTLSEEKYSEIIVTSGHGPRDATVKRLCIKIREKLGPEEFDFGDIDDDVKVISDKTKELESRLREMINKKLTLAFGADWCKGKRNDVLPTEMFNILRKSAQRDINNNEKYIDEGKLYLHLTLSLSKDLIRKHWDKFKDVFTRENSNFADAIQVSDAIDLLGLYRNTDFHDMQKQKERQFLRASDQKTVANAFLRMFDNALKPYDLV